MSHQDNPHYLELVERLLDAHYTTISAGSKKGLRYEVRVVHKHECPVFSGGLCDCDCEASLVECGDPESN